MAAAVEMGIYAPLDKKREEIRVIDLAPGKPTDSISATLSTVSLIDDPSFEAISYVWGDPKEKVPITLSTRTLPVTLNLEAALRRVRLLDAVRRVWADAVCINQDDIPERNSQVLLMRKVYSQCTKVLIWLGEEVESDRLALDFVNSWQRHKPAAGRRAAGGRYGATATVLSSMGPEWGQWVNLLEDLDSLPQTRHLNVHACYQRRDQSWTDHQLGILALRRILQRPWWVRAWTLQEIALAKQADILCGSLTFDWNAFVDFDNAMSFHLGTVQCCAKRFGKYCDDCQGALEFCQHRISIIQNSIGSQAEYRIQTLSVLEIHREREATNPRDHLYAYLGLAKGSRWLKVVPDYSASVELVYINYAMNEIRKSRILKTLAHAAHNGPQSLQLPSWVPDWSSKYCLQAGQLDIGRSRVAHYDDYCACEKYNNPIPVFYKNKILAQEAVQLGSITHLGPTYIQSDVNINWDTLRIWKEIVQLDHDMSQRYSHGPDTNEVSFWRTVLGDAIVTGNAFKFTRIETELRNHSGRESTKLLVQKWYAFLEKSFQEANSVPVPQKDQMREPKVASRGLSFSLKSRHVQRLRERMDDRLLRFRINTDTADELSTFQDDLASTRTPEPKRTKLWQEATVRAILVASCGRRFFVTDAGYMGTGPSHLKAGDDIWILQGGKWPLALRRAGNELLSTRSIHKEVETRKNLGECYVHGVMDGEAQELFGTQMQVVYLE